MANEESQRQPSATSPEGRPLTPEARRALEEAEIRRRQAVTKEAPPREVGGRDAPEPTRYGDWEKGGIASDF